MTKDIERRFMALANVTCSAAADINCSIEDYVDGLGIIIEDLRSCVDAANDDLNKQDNWA